MQGFRPPRADDQGDEAPPPGPPTLFFVFRVRETHVRHLPKSITFPITGGEEESLAGERFGESLSHT